MALIIYKILDSCTAADVDWLANLGGGFIAIGFGSLIIIGAIIGSVQINKELDYAAAVDKRDAIVRGIEQVEAGEHLTYNPYSDAAEFNANLRKTKRYADSPWLDLMFNDLIAHNIDYITIPSGGNS